jgi:hypothetical protein
MLASLNNEKLKQKYIEHILNKEFNGNEDIKETEYSDEHSVSDDDRDETERTYNINNKEYIHVYEDDLNEDLSLLLESNSTENYDIKFILMYVNDELKMPFSQYFFERVENEMVLPKAVISKSSLFEKSKDYANDLDYDSNHYVFIDELKKTLKTNYSIDQKDIDYRGYTVKDSVVYVLCNIQTTLFDNGYMAIYDEIVNTGEIQHTSIQNNVVDFFKEHVNIQQFLDMEENMIDVPIHCYMCNYDNENKKLINIKMDDMFEDMIDHKLFGTNYVFSEALLNSDKTTEYKKYAVFVNDVLFQYEDISKLAMSGGGNGQQLKEMDDYSSIMYHDGDLHTFILVKNYEQFCMIE